MLNPSQNLCSVTEICTNFYAIYSLLCFTCIMKHLKVHSTFKLERCFFFGQLYLRYPKIHYISSLFSAIILQDSTSVQAMVLFNDRIRAVIECLFPNGLSHFCLVCCISNTSLPIGNTSSSSANTTVTVELYNLDTSDSPVLYCKVSAWNVSKANCSQTYQHHNSTQFNIEPGIWLALYNCSHHESVLSFQTLCQP